MDVHAAELYGDAPSELLYPEENAHISRAVAKRRNEFIAVRHCARIALAELGLVRPPLVPGEAGAPTWPPGMAGSMTHCHGYRAAVVGQTACIAAVGIDAEPDEQLPPGILASIASVSEQCHLSDLSEAARGPNWDRLLFSAKESVYKAWFPLMRRWLGFEDAELRIALDGTFTAELLVDPLIVNGQVRTSVAGRWLSANGLLLTSVSVPP